MESPQAEISKEIIAKAESIAKTILKGCDVEIRAQRDGSIKVIEVRKKTI